jgi:hypothetical protein
MFQAAMLAKLEMVTTYFSCFDHVEHANKNEWDWEMHISAQGLSQCSSRFLFSFYLKEFSRKML